MSSTARRLPADRSRRTLSAGVLVCVGLVVVSGACSGDDGTQAAPRTAAEGTSATLAPTRPADAATTSSTAPPASALSLPVTADAPGIEPGFTVHRPADMEASGRPLPVVVWANGGCVRFDDVWNPLFERWAEAGFFVVSLAEPPSGDIAQSAQEALANPTTVDDQAALIDWSFRQNEPDGLYPGQLDTQRVVAAGNSCGGITALGLASRDPRVTSVFVLSGSSTIPGADPEAAAEVMGRVAVPVGFVVGGPSDDLAYAQAFQDYELLSGGIPAMVANRSSGDHPTVSTSPPILEDVADIGLAWMDLTLYGTEAAAGALNSDRVCEGCEPGLWTVTTKHLDAVQTG